MFYLVTLLNRFAFQLFYLRSVQNVYKNNSNLIFYWEILNNRKKDRKLLMYWLIKNRDSAGFRHLLSHFFPFPWVPLFEYFSSLNCSLSETETKLQHFLLTQKVKDQPGFICFPQKQRQEAAQHGIFSLLGKIFQIFYQMQLFSRSYVIPRDFCKMWTQEEQEFPFPQPTYY